VIDNRRMMNALDIDGLEKSFGATRAVDGVSLTAGVGDVVAILGPNGAGKSTTIEAVLGLIVPDSGTVRLFGRTPDEAVAAGLVGAMLQTGQLVRDLSVRELVTMVAALYPASMNVGDVIDLADIGAIAERRTQTLSGGQTQRVRLALALVNNADLLVLDEPTVAMDVECRHAFWTAIRELSATGKSVVFATHYLDEADANADRAVLLSGGRVVADAPTTEIRALVGLRTIRATLPGVPIEALGRVPGVVSADRHGDAAILSCNDADAALGGLFARHPGIRDIEVTSAGLEQAFLELTR
jgi:ABC-2 type transport system ATP-binding protein